MFALNKSALAGLASTSLFVLLWSSGAIASKWGLAHSSPFAFLVFRFGIALACLLPLARCSGCARRAARVSAARPCSPAW